MTDNHEKKLPYKEKDFSKYLRLLTSVSNTHKLKPILIDENNKKKKKKKTKIMKRNIEIIKTIEKTGNVYPNSSKHLLRHPRKKYTLKNLKGCKKFVENPQLFFTEELCDAILLSYRIDPHEFKTRTRSTSADKTKKETK